VLWHVQSVGHWVLSVQVLGNARQYLTPVGWHPASVTRSAGGVLTTPASTGTGAGAVVGVAVGAVGGVLTPVGGGVSAVPPPPTATLAQH
jgi:hypothetical protein